MNNLYHLSNKQSDYDTLNNMVVVSDSEDNALKMIPKPYSSSNFTASLIGYTDKPLNTIILQDY